MVDEDVSLIPLQVEITRWSMHCRTNISDHSCSVWTTGCRSWYNQGNPGGKVTAQYPGSLVHWRKLLENPRYEDFELSYRSKNRFQFMGNGFTLEEVDGRDLSWYLDPEFVAKPLFDH